MAEFLDEDIEPKERDETYVVDYYKFMAFLELKKREKEFDGPQFTADEKEKLCRERGLLFGYEKILVEEYASKVFSLSVIASVFLKAFQRPISKDTLAIECLSFASKTKLACQLNPVECFSNLGSFKDKDKFTDKAYCVANSVVIHNHILHCYCRKGFFHVDEEKKEVTIILKYRIYPFFALVAASQNKIYDLQIKTSQITFTNVDECINSVFNDEKYSKDIIFVLSSNLPCENVEDVSNKTPVGSVYQRFGENLAILGHPVFCCNSKSSKILSPAIDVLHNWTSFFDKQRSRNCRNLDIYYSKNVISNVATHLLSSFEKFPSLMINDKQIKTT